MNRIRQGVVMPMLSWLEMRVIIWYLISIVVEPIITVAYATVHHALRLKIVPEHTGAHCNPAVRSFGDVCNDLLDSPK